MIKKIYIDTSVYGGYFDEEFKKETKLFFETLRNRKIKVVSSETLEVEIYRAPNFVIELYESLRDNIDIALRTDAVNHLAEQYISENVVGKTSLADCEHIAFATIYKVDVLVSWNFKHIVNLERIRDYNKVNLDAGYNLLEIRTPSEVFIYE